MSSAHALRRVIGETEGRGAGAGGRGIATVRDSTAFAALGPRVKLRARCLRASCLEAPDATFPCRMREPIAIHIADATEHDLECVAVLAGVIWRRHYPGIISSGQIDYMLALGYSHEALERFIAEPGAGLLLAHADERLVGFAAYYRPERTDELKLDKLYVHHDYHGRGVGSRLIGQVEAAAKAQALPTLILNVNKNNVQAIRAYEANGFAIRDSVVIDIGGGYVMDDYVMAKRLSR